MRVFLLLIVLMGVGAGLWVILPHSPEDERARLAASARAASARIGVQKMLSESDLFDFTNVVVSANSQGEGFEFRAMALQQGASRPVYGQAAAQCDDALEAARCWEIVLLEVDGRPVDLGLATVPAASEEAAPLKVPEPEDVPTEPSAEGGSEQVSESATADPEAVPDTSPAGPTEPESTPEPAAAPVEAEQSSGPIEEPADAAGPRSPTHVVDRPIVNARSGPGTENPVLTTLSGGTQLNQLDERDGWGQFEVLSGDSEGQTVWIALSIVTPVQP